MVAVDVASWGHWVIGRWALVIGAIGHSPLGSLVIGHCALCIVHCALCIVHCALGIGHWALGIRHWVLWRLG